MTGYEPRGTGLARAASRIVALCMLTGVLSACETIGTIIPGSPGETRPAEPKSAPGRPGVVMPAAPSENGPGLANAQKPAPPSQTAEAIPPEPAVAALPPAEPEVNADPKQLLGMGRTALTDLLGTPSFVRNEAPSYLWRYRDKVCLLDLFLYEDGAAAAKQLKVAHYNVRSKGAGVNLSAEQCLKRLLLARTEKSSG